jgi:hypothetical protein
MASGAAEPGMAQQQDSGKAAAGLERRRFFFTRSDGRGHPPRLMKETVSGCCDAINWMTLLFAQFID